MALKLGKYANDRAGDEGTIHNGVASTFGRVPPWQEQPWETMKSKKTITTKRRCAARVVEDYAFRHHGEQCPNQGRIQELADNHPHARKVSTHNHQWTMVMGKRVAREETKEVRMTD